MVEVLESITGEEGEDNARDDTVVDENVTAGVERVELALLSTLETDVDDAGGVAVGVPTGTLSAFSAVTGVADDALEVAAAEGDRVVTALVSVAERPSEDALGSGACVPETERDVSDDVVPEAIFGIPVPGWDGVLGEELWSLRNVVGASVAEGASMVLLLVVVLETLWVGAVTLEETNVVVVFVGLAEVELVLWTASDVFAAPSTVEADDVAAIALVLPVLAEGSRMLVGLCDVCDLVVVVVVGIAKEVA